MNQENSFLPQRREIITSTLSEVINSTLFKNLVKELSEIKHL